MRRYADGDAAAFDALYQRHKDATWAYALRQLGDEASAADAQQAIWMRVIEQRSRYQPNGRFRSYLFTLAHNAITDEHRRRTRSRGRLSDVDADTLTSGDDPGQRFDQGETHQALLNAIRQLPSAQRDAVLLKAESGLSLDDIAEVTGSEAETVKSRLRYALRKLRDALGADHLPTDSRA